MESDRFTGGEFKGPAEGFLCAPCRLVPPPFERAVALAVYQNEIREMVHLLKYERMRSVAQPLGDMLARAIAKLALAGEVWVVAVPLYPSKERQRGYNQAALLADQAIKRMREAVAPLHLVAHHGSLRRIRDTESQFVLSTKGRRANLRGAFAVSAENGLSGRTVLLVDDIYTTGATARECSRVLRRAGAAKVLVATLARAQTERAAFWNADGSLGEGKRNRED